MSQLKICLFLLKIGLAFCFIYASLGSFLNPDNWIGYFPQFLKAVIPSTVLLTGFPLFELVLAVWILSGWRLFYSSLIACFALIGIIIFNLNQMDVIFRDVTILFTALALAVYSYPGNSKI